MMIIAPKVAKFRKHYTDPLRSTPLAAPGARGILRWH